MTSILPHRKYLSLGAAIKDTLEQANDKENAVQEIVKSITTNEILEFVSMYDLGIDDKSIESSIRDAVFRNRHVTSLGFYNTVVDLNELSNGLRQMKGLQVLHLDQCEMNGTEPESFARVLLANRTLREFCLWQPADSEVGDGAAFALARSLRFRSSLNEFYLSGCILSQVGFQSISEALQRPSSLETLGLYCDTAVMTDESAELLAQGIAKNTSLVKLSLSLSFVSPNDVRSLLDALAKNRTLKDVSLFKMQLDANSSGAIARSIAGSETIEKLWISGTLEVTFDEVDTQQNIDIDLAPVSQALSANQSLKSFRLSDCSLRLDDTSIVRRTEHHNSTLERLELSDCYIDTTAVLQVCRIIEKCSGLQRCSISGCVAMDSEALFSFLKGANQNQSLESLTLGNTQIGDRGAMQLGEFISGHQTLHELYLEDNNFTDDGFVSLGSALARNTMLKCMELENEDAIGERGIRAILDGIKENSSLTAFTFLEGELSQSQEDELEFYTERNDHLRPLLKESLCLGLWPRALIRASKYRYYRDDDEDDEEEERFETPDMLYFLVREKHVELLSNVRRSRKRKRGEQ